MRKVFLLLLGIVIFPIFLFGQAENGYVRTSMVLQIWNIENVPEAISEGTLPIEFVYPIRDNVQLQINHSPATSKFGDVSMTGLSDTWIKANYSFAGDNAIASIGLGLPTGKTKLDSSQLILAKFLSWQSFQFLLPVYGQGLTLSGGLMYAYPFTDKLTVGGGANFVYRGKYNYSDQFSADLDPGEQIGLNVGVDYLILDNLQGSFDFVFNYYTADKLDNVEIFASGPKFLAKLALQYQRGDQFYWLQVFYQAKAKNQIYDYLNEKLKPEPKNSNITIREMHVGAKFKVAEKVSLSVIGEIRSYVENEYNHGWTDLAGGGVVGEYQFSDQLSLFSGVKLFFGDGQILAANPAYQGYEFKLGSQWSF
ncbi:MAG: hypothetical protein GXO74_15400 [Calditrichaeota bacterium]|nr:hypothetical protein [Calditrichota bacterium]